MGQTFTFHPPWRLKAVRQGGQKDLTFIPAQLSSLSSSYLGLPPRPIATRRLSSASECSHSKHTADEWPPPLLMQRRGKSKQCLRTKAFPAADKSGQERHNPWIQTHWFFRFSAKCCFCLHLLTEWDGWRWRQRSVLDEWGGGGQVDVLKCGLHQFARSEL